MVQKILRAPSTEYWRLRRCCATAERKRCLANTNCSTFILVFSSYDELIVPLGGQQYNAAHSKGVRTVAPKSVASKAEKAPAAAASKTAATKENRSNMSVAPPAPKAATTARVVTKSSSIPTSPIKKRTVAPVPAPAPAVPSVASAKAIEEIAALKASNEQSGKDLAELQLEMDGLAKERDFYFEKLRDVEMILQDLEDNGKGNELTASIFKILYATADGFEQLDVDDKAAAEENNDSTIAVEEPVVQFDSIYLGVEGNDAETY